MGHTHSIAIPKTYYYIFAALMVLTFLTVAVSYIPFKDPVWHTGVALTIAVIKATLVVVFFMHALESPPLTWLSLVGAVLWLTLLFIFTLADVLTRSWLVS